MDEIDRTVRFDHYQGTTGRWWVTRVETTTSLAGVFDTYDEAKSLSDRLSAEEPTE